MMLENGEKKKTPIRSLFSFHSGYVSDPSPCEKGNCKKGCCEGENGEDLCIHGSVQEEICDDECKNCEKRSLPGT